MFFYVFGCSVITYNVNIYRIFLAIFRAHLKKKFVFLFFEIISICFYTVNIIQNYILAATLVNLLLAAGTDEFGGNVSFSWAQVVSGGCVFYSFLIVILLAAHSGVFLIYYADNVVVKLQAGSFSSVHRFTIP